MYLAFIHTRYPFSFPLLFFYMNATLLFSYPCLSNFTLTFFYSLCCASLFLSYLCKFLLLSFIFIPILYFIIILIYITNVNSIMQRMIEVLLMKTNTSCVHLMLHYDATWRFIRFIYWFMNTTLTIFIKRFSIRNMKRMQSTF